MRQTLRTRMHLLKIALVIFLVQNSVNLFAQAADISEAQIAAIPEQRWSNDSIKPALTVTMDQVQLAENTDYTAVYTDNVNKGTATVTITGKGNYTGTSSATFVIADFPLLDPESPNSEENPYLISTEEDLKAWAGLVSSGKRTNGFYKQTADITLEKEHITIGYYNGSYTYTNYVFKGTFDGDNHFIDNMTMYKPGNLQTKESYLGLFGRLVGATVKNVKIINCNLNCPDHPTPDVGGIAGYVDNCNITNCSVNGNLNGKQYVGGIAGGANASTISNCSFSGIITGVSYSGGIVGSNGGKSILTNNINTGSISGSRCIGGISGENSSSLIGNINTGTITGTGYLIGGITGLVSHNCTLTGNFNAGQVKGEAQRIGSIAGYLYSNYNLADNFYLPGLGLDGAIGELNSTSSSDIIGCAEIIVKISASQDVELTLPSTPAYVWNEESYYRSGTEITLGYSVPSGKVFDCYSASNCFLSNAGVKDGAHVLTDFTDDVIITGSYADEIINLEGNATIANIANLTYNGQQQLVKPVVTIGETVLEESKNYNLSYNGECINAGSYIVTVTGTGRYSGTLTKTFKINTFNISADDAITVTGLDSDYPKTGDAVHPVPANISCTATGADTLFLDTDYTLSYGGDCIMPDTYTLTIKGKGNYTGQRSIDFVIDDAYGFTVNDGTATSYNSPFDAQSITSYQKNEFIVSKDELSALNGKILHGMKFYLTRIPVSPSAYDNKYFKVFIKEVNSTNHTSFYGMEGATVVYDGTFDLATNLFLTIPFTTPYTYNGGNLLIGFYEYQVSNMGSGTSFYGVTTGKSIEGINNSSLDNITKGYSNDFQPKTTFLYDEQRTYIDGATVEAIPDQRYSNLAITPSLAVSYNDVPLVENTDYIVSYSDNVNAGTATATITGIGEYRSSKAVTFKIVDFPLLDPESENSAENPYLISTEEDLKLLASIVNTGGRNDGFYKQTGDITLTEEHIAIGYNNNNYNTYPYAFKGTYDGDNKFVKNITIIKQGSNDLTDGYQGLFGYLMGATIQNVRVENCNIAAYVYIGGIAGSAGSNTTISNCYVSGTISGIASMGGIVGVSGSASIITNNINAATLIAKNGDIGGIVGRLQGSDLKYNVNTGTVSGGKYVGGIIGFNFDYKGDINFNFNIGQVTCTDSYAGSIYGGANSVGRIKNNYYAAGLGLPGGRGNDTADGVDASGAEIVAKVTATEGVTLGLPATPTYVWNEENYYASVTEITLDYNVPSEKIFDCYTVSSGLISDAEVKDGTHTLTGFTDNVVISGSYADEIVSLEGNALIADIEDITYNGLQQLFKPIVTIGEKVLVEGGNYELSYSGDCINVGEYTVTVTGKGCYTGTLTKQFNIVALNVNTADVFEITGIDTDYPKKDAAVNPIPTITNVVSKAKLVLDTDFTLSYSDGCILPGTYTLSIIGKGNYTGRKDIEFVIDNVYGLTVNDGTVTTNQTPIYTQHADCYQKDEFMLYASDIQTLNGQIIYGMKFYMTQKSNKSFGNGRFKVLLKEIEGSPSGFVCGDGATAVYDGELDVTTNEFLTIHFTTPYKYNGGNLVVGFYEYEMGNYVSVSFYGVSSNTGFNYRYDTYGLNVSGWSHEYKQPKTTFLYEAESTTVADVVTVEEKSDDAWYDLSGKQLENMPTEKGLYFHGNHLYMITE